MMTRDDRMAINIWMINCHQVLSWLLEQASDDAAANIEVFMAEMDAARSSLLYQEPGILADHMRERAGMKRHALPENG